jgi:sugar lactone lactonase YvrE
LTYGDLDGDGLKEVIWAPPEWVDATESPNPDRLIVFEQKKDGGDTLGVYDGEGNFMPNSAWTISSDDNDAVRPRRMFVQDMDGDDTLEVIFSDRRATTGDWYFGICSVDTIPNDETGGTWVVEARGQDFGIGSPADNKYDAAMLTNRLYLFDEFECTQIRFNDLTGEYEQGPSQSTVLPNGGSWNGAVVADIDGNAEPEIIVGSYWDNLAEGQTHGVYVYTDIWPPGETRDETTQLDTLKGFKIADLGAYMSSSGVMGGAVGDADQDGLKEYIFGSRDADPNGAIFRLEYNGTPDSVHRADYWELSLIDSVYPEITTGSGRWDEIAIANIDSDPNEEVLFTSSVPAGGSLGVPDTPQPIYVLNNTTVLNPGPWQKIEVPYRFERVFADNRGAGHGIAVDKYGNVWYGDYQNGIEIFDKNGTPIDTITQFTLPKIGGGGDTTLVTTSCRGMNKDFFGNILFCRAGWMIQIDVDTREALAWVEVTYPLNPGVDEAGFIYVGDVIGISPVEVFDPATLEKVQEIILPDPPSYGRGLDVSLDGLTIYSSALIDGPHSVPIYTSTDNQNYFKTDSIENDNLGNPIMKVQTVTVNTKPVEGTIWYSLDNSYAGGGAENEKDNSLAMMDFGNYTYGYLYMPPPPNSNPGDPPDAYNGPRNAAWSASGDTIYVASYNGERIYMFVHDNVSAIGEMEPGVPIAFNLEQNYPNPFNPVTTIDFSIPKAGKTTLTVYNVLGQRVITLVNQNMPKGKFSVQFDASNYATGMYIYRLQTTEGVLQKRMMLIK